MIFNWPVVFLYNAEQFGSCAAQPSHTRCCSMRCLGLLSGLSSLLCSHSVSAVVYFPPLEGSFTFLIFHGIFLSIFMTLTRMKLLHHNEIAAAPCKIRRDERNWGSILYIVLFKHLLMIILIKHLETRLMMCWALQPRIKRLAWRRRCLGLARTCSHISQEGLELVAAFLSSACSSQGLVLTYFFLGDHIAMNLWPYGCKAVC